MSAVDHEEKVKHLLESLPKDSEKALKSLLSELNYNPESDTIFLM